MPRRFSISLLRTFAILNLFPPLFAQKADVKFDARKSSFESELIVSTEAPVGSTDVLQFTPDGKFLFAAGDDKVLRVWPFTVGKGLDTAGRRDFRWTIYKQQRGSIYAAALSPDQTKIAVAGFGIRYGAISVFSMKDGKVVNGFWSNPNLPREKQLGKVIWSIAWAPDNQTLAVGDDRGDIWVWDTRKKDGVATKLGSHPESATRARSGRTNRIKNLFYTGRNQLISVAEDRFICSWNPREANQAPRKLATCGVAEIVDAVIDPQQRWMAVCGQQAANSHIVEIHSLRDGEVQRIGLPTGGNAWRFPRCLALDKTGRKLAVGYYAMPKEAGFREVVFGGVLLYDLTRKNGGSPSLFPVTWEPDQVAFHPSGKYLAVAGGDNFEINVWDIANSKKPLNQVRSSGACLWDISVTSDDRYLAFRQQRATFPSHPNERAKGDWRVFDLKDLRWATKPGIKDFEKDHRVPLRELNGWKVDTQPTQQDKARGYVPRYDWYVYNNKTRERYRIPLIRHVDIFPRCYSFIGKPGGKTYLAVGHYWGFSLFEVSNGSEPRLIRKGVGHQGEVMALIPSADGKLLYTASRDQSIACWNLQPHLYQRELGAQFEKNRDGKTVTVLKVQPGSPAWEARLQEDDRITLFAYSGKLVRGGPDAWLEILKNPTPQKECYFRLERKGENGKPRKLDLLTTVRQRPLYRFYPTRQDDWVLWSYYEYFYACSTNGDRHIGWQLSAEVDKAPSFDKAEQYRNRYYQPKKIQQFLTRLNDFDKKPGENRERKLQDPVRGSVLLIEPPQVEVAAVEESVNQGNAEIDFRVVASGEREGNETLTKLNRVNVWLNGYQFASIPLRGKKAIEEERSLTIPNKLLRQGDNYITVQAYNNAEVRRQDTVKIVCKRAKKEPELYSLMVGVGDYKGINNAPANRGIADLGNLKADKDAEGLAKIWATQQGKLFAKIHSTVLVNDKASRGNILLNHLQTLKDKVGPDDYLLLYLGGHGASDEQVRELLAQKKARLEETVDPSTFFFCAHGINLRRPVSTSVTGSILYQKLHDLNCHKIILLDACHSQAAIGVDPVRSLTPDGIGPVIFSACMQNQQAFESRDLSELYGRGLVQGLFSIAIFEALSHAMEIVDQDKNGVVYPEEMSNFLRARVPELLIDAGAKVKTPQEGQNPVAFIPEHAKNLPLFQK